MENATRTWVRILDVRMLSAGDLVRFSPPHTYTFQRVNWADNAQWVELEFVGWPGETYQPTIRYVEQYGWVSPD